MTASDLLRYRDTIAQLLVGHSKPYPSYPIFMYLLTYSQKSFLRNDLASTLVGNNNVPPQKNVESLYGFIPYTIEFFGRETSYLGMNRETGGRDAMLNSMFR